MQAIRCFPAPSALSGAAQRSVLRKVAPSFAVSHRFFQSSSTSSGAHRCNAGLCPCAKSKASASSSSSSLLLTDTLNQQIRHHNAKVDPSAKTVSLSFKQSDGTIHKVRAPIGKSLLEVAHLNEIPVEGACEGSLACSTCHVILSNSLFSRLAEPCEDEEDMLDLAPDLEDTSRLGCQVIVDEGMEGEEVMLPSHTLNFYVDGHQPMGH